MRLRENAADLARTKSIVAEGSESGEIRSARGQSLGLDAESGLSLRDIADDIALQSIVVIALVGNGQEVAS